MAANGRLRWRGASPVEHVLERDSAAPPFTDRITLERAPWTPPAAYRFGEDELVPFRAAESIAWRLVEAGDQ